MDRFLPVLSDSLDAAAGLFNNPVGFGVWQAIRTRN